MAAHTVSHDLMLPNPDGLRVAGHPLVPVIGGAILAFGGGAFINRGLANSDWAGEFMGKYPNASRAIGPGAVGTGAGVGWYMYEEPGMIRDTLGYTAVMGAGIAGYALIEAAVDKFMEKDEEKTDGAWGDISADDVHEALLEERAAQGDAFNGQWGAPEGGMALAERLGHYNGVPALGHQAGDDFAGWMAKAGQIPGQNAYQVRVEHIPDEQLEAIAGGFFAEDMGAGVTGGPGVIDYAEPEY